MGRFQKRAVFGVALVVLVYGILIGLLFLAIRYHFDTKTDDIGVLVIRQGGKVQGDRRDAYRERAEQLHAMIALKTGLPLHEIPA